MQNFYKNLVYFTRETNITFSELNDWPYIDYEQYMVELSETLEREGREAKKQQETLSKSYSRNSMASQIRSMMNSYKK